MFPCDMSIFNFSFFISFGFQGKSLVLIELILGHSLSFPFNKNWMANFSHIYAPNFEKVGSILVSACAFVRPFVRSKQNSS